MAYKVEMRPVENSCCTSRRYCRYHLTFLVQVFYAWDKDFEEFENFEEDRIPIAQIIRKIAEAYCCKGDNIKVLRFHVECSDAGKV